MKSTVDIHKNSHVAIYLQIANSIIKDIKAGVLKPNQKLSGSRELSLDLKVHRKTVVNAYKELDR